jgi:hypothetical protein
MLPIPAPRWQLLIYRLPSNPSRARVAIWRELRRLGALPLQQAVSAVPELGDLPDALDGIVERIERDGGTVYRYALADLTTAQQARLVDEWNALRGQEFAEIVEECETKFTREVEFEIFRANLTAGEAEEIEADLDKIRGWFARVAARDWFDAPNRAAAETAIAACETLLDDFVQRVYMAEMADGPALDPPAALTWGEFPRLAPLDETDDTKDDAGLGSDSVEDKRGA